MRAIFFAIVIAVLGACKSARPAPDGPASCENFVTKLDQCDPTAADMPLVVRSALRAGCPEQSRQCARIDTSSDGGCNAFMGCLYDGD